MKDGIDILWMTNTLTECVLNLLGRGQRESWFDGSDVMDDTGSVNLTGAAYIFYKV
jgi:hypothetical protein